MQHKATVRHLTFAALAAIALAAGVVRQTASLAQTRANEAASGAPACAEDAGITLPPGFCATIFADKLGHPRHLAVATDGTVYVNTWSGIYYQNDTPPPGGFLIAMKDTKGSGHADRVQRFGMTMAEGGHGGTGIAIYKDGLYAEINDR